MGLELLLPILVEKVIGSVFGQKAAEVALENPEAMASGSSVLLVAGVFLLRKVLKTPDKLLKFRIGFDKSVQCIGVIYSGAKMFSKYMKDKCIGGVCELPKKDKDAD